MVSVDTRMSVSISVVAHLQFYYAFHKAELACSRIQYSEIDRERNCNSDATPNARTVCMPAIHKIVDGTPREDHLPRSLISCQVSSSVENSLSPYSVTAVRFYNVNLIVPPSSFKKTSFEVRNFVSRILNLQVPLCGLPGPFALWRLCRPKIGLTFPAVLEPIVSSLSHR